MKNPFLWPKLWQRNPYITNPHWIYPGNPVRLNPLEEPKKEEGEEGAEAEAEIPEWLSSPREEAPVEAPSGEAAPIEAEAEMETPPWVEEAQEEAKERARRTLLMHPDPGFKPLLILPSSQGGIVYFGGIVCGTQGRVA